MRGPRTSARRWLGDLIFGVRLAIGSGRSPWGRLALTAIGIGLGVAVLLLASSLQTINQNRQEHLSARSVSDIQRAAEDAAPKLLALPGSTEFRGERLQSMLLEARQPDAPTPPGVSRLPGPGESVVSPETLRLLQSPGGDQLRPRLGQRIVGVIDSAGLAAPDELFYYQGTDELTPDTRNVRAVYQHFGERPDTSTLLGDLRILLVFGVTALLVPVVVFVSATSRFAESTRQRRLAALRLVGASGRQIRRIASGEALIGSVLGVLLGWGVYLATKALVTGGVVAGLSLYPSAVQPTWWCAGLVTVGIPVIAVGTAVASMRRTVVEPLGVVRNIIPTPRRLVWRCAPIVAGIVGLLLADLRPVVPIQSTWLVSSVVLILVGVPLVLPWVVERTVRSFGGGSVSWQLAVRRLQLTAGTAARSVSAIAVVLTGVIALQTVLATLNSVLLEAPSQNMADEARPAVEVSGTAKNEKSGGEVTRELSALPAVANATDFQSLRLRSENDYQSAVIMDCATLRESVGAGRCHRGDAFFVAAESAGVVNTPSGGTWYSDSGVVNNRTPPEIRLPPPRPLTLPGEGISSVLRQMGLESGTLVLTPDLVANIPVRSLEMHTSVELDPTSTAALDQVRNVAAEHLLAPEVLTSQGAASGTVEGLLAGIQYGLLIGTLITFGLITCGLFVTAAEQIQERRRPMAVLGAVGTRSSELGWSLLLQNALPMVAAVGVSLVLGLALGGLVVRLIGNEMFVVDIVGLVGLLGVAVLSVLVVTALTLPVVGRAMRPEWLRTE